MNTRAGRAACKWGVKAAVAAVLAREPREGFLSIKNGTTLGDKCQIHTGDSANAVVAAAEEELSPDIGFVLSDLSLIQRLIYPNRIKTLN